MQRKPFPKPLDRLAGRLGLKALYHDGDPEDTGDDDSIDDDVAFNTGCRGRPSPYRTSYPKLCRNMRMLGYSGPEIGKVFGVHHATLMDWRNAYPEFDAAWWEGGAVADARVARAVYKRAVGYSHKAVKMFFNRDNGSIIEHEYTERYPPDTAAGTYWLNNRQPGLWKSVNSTALTGADGKDLATPPSINVMIVEAPAKRGPVIAHVVEDDAPSTAH